MQFSKISKDTLARITEIQDEELKLRLALKGVREGTLCSWRNRSFYGRSFYVDFPPSHQLALRDSEMKNILVEEI